MKKTEPFNSIINIAGQYKDSVLTYNGSLIGAIKLSGADPASLSENMLMLITEMIKAIFDILPINCSLSNYYIHYNEDNISKKKYSNDKVNLLINKRVNFLNNKIKLNGACLIWVLEIYPDDNLNKINSLSFFKNLFSSFFDEEARKKIKIALSSKSSFLIEEKSLNKMKDTLFSLLKDIDAKLAFISFDNEIQSNKDLWNLNRFLVNFNKEYLIKKNTSVPIQDWDILLPDGSLTQITYKGHSLLKLNGVKPIYLKIAHVTQFGDEYLPYGIWAVKKSTPVLQSGNYVYFTRMRKMSDIERTFLFKSKKDALNRSQISFTDMMSNINPDLQIQNKIKTNPKLKEDLEKLEIERSSNTDYCYFISSIVLFEENPDDLIDSIEKINRILTDNMNLIWENAGALVAFERIQIGYKAKSYRDFEFTTLQAAACSILYRSNNGRKYWGEYKNEYAYIFESIDKSAFYYSSYVNEKDLTICVGPTRSGKSFVRNVLATHYRKYNGIYISIDIDAGTEPLAQFYEEDSAIFKLPRDDEKFGLNPLKIARSANDTEWIAHFSVLIRDLLKLNDSESMKSFTASEQLAFDNAVIFELIARDDPNSLTPVSLTTVASVAGESVKMKLKRFLRGGQYGYIFDNDDDAVGILNKHISVYNLSAVKDNTELLGLVQREILYRVIQVFEDPKLLNVPKRLDMDECMYSFSTKGTVDLMEKKVRTWAKQQCGISLWTQSPVHYLSMQNWSTFRASASTFIFMPDYTAITEYENYNKAFGLTRDECELIASLTPKKQMYLKQPDIDVAKVINLNVEAEQYILCTSTAEEMLIRNEVMNKYKNKNDYNLIISETIKQINNELGKKLEETKE